MRGTLENKVALVTGASRGIGAAVAQSLAGRGALVIAASRKPTPLEDNRLFSQALDVADEASVLAAFHWIEERFGRLDILVNNAGIFRFQSILETSFAEWNDLFAVNVTGSFLCAKEAIRLMRKTGGGRILNLGSIAETRPLPNNACYSASKASIRALTGAINEEEKGNGIRATLVTLGATSTEIWSDSSGFSRKDMLEAPAIAEIFADIAATPLGIRLDEIQLFPPKGVL